MKKRTTMKKWIAAISLIILGGAMSACAMGGASWKEEVLLQDGQKIIVERSVERGGRHEIGQKPPYKEQSLAFTIPISNETITWEDHYSEDVGSANFLPMLLDISKGTPYLVVNPMGCLSYNKWGRPNPPYVIFKYDGKTWQRIPLQELPTEIKTPNLIFSMPDIKVEESGKRFMSSEMIKAITEGYRQPEYKTILREAVVKPGDGITSCLELVNYKGKWIMPNDPVMRAIIDRKSK
jgi:hypothetical protein